MRLASFAFYSSLSATIASGTVAVVCYAASFMVSSDTAVQALVDTAFIGGGVSIFSSCAACVSMQIDSNSESESTYTPI